MPIEPDTKDWTWVLQRPCPECGFIAADVRREDVASLVRANAASWTAVLDRGGASLRTRPRADRWAPIEYACHVRDVFTLYRTRLGLMLEHDDPNFENWDQDRTAIDDVYLDQDPHVVGAQLAAAAESLALAFDVVRGDDWSRRGERSDGASFTIETFATYMVHDPIHHLYDVTGRPADAP